MKKGLFMLLLAVSFFSFSQEPLVTVPMELHGDHIMIKVQVDDSEPLDFIFDTGDGLTVIDLDIARALQLDLDHKQSTTSAGGKITGALIKHNKVEIEDLTMDSDIKVYATSLKHLEISIGRNIDGIIGYDILHNYAVRINYDSNQFEIFDKGSAPGKGDKVNFKLHNAIPVINANLTLNNGETLKGEFYVNTGAGTTMDFNTPFANKNDIVEKTGDHYSYLVAGLEDSESLHYEGRVKMFAFGSFRIQDMPIGISQSQRGIQNDKKVAGIIGNRLLSRFNLTIDYKNNVFYFEPNERFKNNYTVNASGIDVQLNEDLSKVLIHQVYADSPAEQAGLKINDVLLSINGQDAIELGVVRIRKMLRETGKEVTITFLREGEEKRVTLKLKPLI